MTGTPESPRISNGIVDAGRLGTRSSIGTNILVNMLVLTGLLSFRC